MGINGDGGIIAGTNLEYLATLHGELSTLQGLKQLDSMPLCCRLLLITLVQR